MILGMSLATFTLVHVLISVLGLVSGFAAIGALIARKDFAAWTAVFLASTVATSVTGFFFPFEHLLPSHIVGIISLVVLAIAIAARYVRHLAGPWRRTYAITAVVALYFNTFVAVVQAFKKVPALETLAPTQTEAPFLVAQLAVLAAFVALGILAARKAKAPRAMGAAA